jgi:uncharacterized protein (TIGR02246 family)
VVAESHAAVQAGQEPAVQPGDPELMQLLERLAKAYNAGDAKALAALWSEDGEYLSLDSGEQLSGRKDIEADFAELFRAKPGARLEIDVAKLRRLGDGAAAVEGLARVIRDQQPVARSKFLALLVRQGGQWRIDSVRESDTPESASNAEFLESMSWLNGDWVYKNGDTEVTLHCAEVADGNFRTHKFQVKTNGEIEHQGTQIIGWDPSQQKIRTWVFSNDGSFGEGVIEHQGERWVNRVGGVLPDGDKSSSTQIITRKGDNSFTFQVIDRHVGTRALPNVPEITMTRSATAATKED